MKREGYEMLGIAFMLAITVLYFTDLGIVKILMFWGAFIGASYLPAIGVDAFLANICGFGVLMAYGYAAKTA